MPTPKLTRKQVVLAKIEGTYGTDPTPTGAANAVLASNLSAKPLDPTLVKRNNYRPYIGAQQQLIADVHSQITFDVELAGSGAAGTVPAFDALLQACGLSSTVVASTSVTYAPISAAFPSLTIYYYADGTLHKMTGCRGTVAFDFSVKKIPMMKFTFTGLYNAPTDGANPAAVYTGFKTPAVVSNSNTNSFSFNGYAGNMSSLSIDFKNAVSYRTLVGTQYTQLTDRDISGSVDFEMPLIATADLFTESLSEAISSLALTHGTIAGNICTVTSSGLSIQNPSIKDDSGVLMLSIPFELTPVSGNDEISIVFT